MGIAVVEEVGQRIDRAWRALDFDRPSFAQLAAEHLGAANLSAVLDPEEIMQAVFRGDLPQQSDPTALFGQPPVTLFRTRHFYIDAIFWLDGTTAIHDHAFSGAFQVLSGSSIETTYEFSPTREIGSYLRFGELRVLGSALRAAGDVQTIVAGPAYIHALFHLPRPTVSLVVRTFSDPVPIGQFDYSPAGLARSSYAQDPLRDRILQMVDTLRKADDPRLEQRIGDLIAESDLSTAVAILWVFGKAPDEGLFQRLADRLRDEEARQRVRSWRFHRSRIEILATRRNTVQDQHLRFMLAVLLNAQRRADALSLVAAYAPDVPPAAQIAAWLRQLAATTVRLHVGGSRFEPNVLGLPSFEPGAEEALADLLSDRQRSWTPEEMKFIERLRVLPCLKPLFS